MDPIGLEERRRTAQALRELARQIVTADTADAAFAPLADAAEELARRLAPLPRLVRDFEGLHTRERAAERAGRDPNFDRDPLVGLSNPLAPPLRRCDPEDPNRWELVFGDLYEGHPGFAHGGYVAAVVDHVLGVVAASAGVASMTGTLTLRYRRPTPLGKRLVCRGEVERVEGRKVFCRAVLECDGEVLVESDGIYIRVRPDRY